MKDTVMKPRISPQTNDDGENVWVDQELGLMLKPIAPDRCAERTDREEQHDSAKVMCMGSEGSAGGTSQPRGAKK
jgi:hypothetical protein